MPRALPPLHFGDHCFVLKQWNQQVGSTLTIQPPRQHNKGLISQGTALKPQHKHTDG